MPYKVGLKYTSTFSDGQMHYYIKATNKSTNVTAEYTGTTNKTVQGNTTYTGYSHGTLKKGNGKYTEMVAGEFPSSTSNQTITFNLILQFPDTGENQDSEKGATINGKIVINYEEKNISKTIANLYDKSTKDSNRITPDGLQKDGTGAYNIKNLSSTMRKYSVSLLGNTQNNIIADAETDEYDNIRYVGSNPNNYITFNNETWRIIGIFNNITTIDEQGNEIKESLVKIVRNESLGNYSWDTSDSTINNGYGVNEWSQADLMFELNCDSSNTNYCREDIKDGYLSNLTTGTTTWYNAENNTKTASYDFSKNIKSGWVDKVANIKWNIGGYDTASVSVLDMYKAERGTEHVDYPSDGIIRTSTWDGKIALIYPSDYGYASTDTACRNIMSSLKNRVCNCKKENWLANGTIYWTLSPAFENGTYVFNVDPEYGSVDDYIDSSDFGVRPALFLKSDVVIKSGTGTETDPYILD